MHETTSPAVVSTDGWLRIGNAIRATRHASRPLGIEILLQQTAVAIGVPVIERKLGLERGSEGWEDALDLLNDWANEWAELSAAGLDEILTRIEARP